jgi:hypothetical protein
LFTEYNGYKINKNRTGKLGGPNFQEVIPEIQWKYFYIADMKNTYLISDKGLNYFNLTRFMTGKTTLGKKYVDRSMWLQFA